MRTVGIDIGSYSIKVAEVDSNLKTFRLRDYIELELNHEPGRDLRLEKIEILRRIATQYDPKSYKIAVGIGSEHCTQRILNFPFSERRKILQSLPFELEDVIPFTQEEAIFDFRVLLKRQTSAQVLAMAAPKKNIQEVLVLCEDAGLDPDVVCPDGVALGNHFENCLLPPPMITETQVGTQNAQLIIHIGYEQTIINVVRDRKLFTSRAMYFGGRDLADMVSRTYQIPYLEALKGVSEKGFVLTHGEGADEDQRQFSKVITTGLSRLILEVRRTIIDCRTEFEMTFDHVYLMGGMSRLMNQGPNLTQNLEISTNVYEHLGKIAQVDFSFNEDTDKSSAIAVGLALEALRRPKAPSVNFRKNEFSKQSQDLKLFWEKYQDAFKMAAALFVFFFFYTSIKLTFVEDNLTAVNDAIRTLGKPLNLPKSQLDAAGITRFASAKRKEIMSKKEAMALRKYSSPLEILKTLSAVVPSKDQITLDIRNFNLDNGNLKIEGLVNSPKEASALESSLKRIPDVSSVAKAPITITAPSGKVAFHYTMNLARLPQGSAPPKGKVN